MLWVLIWWVWWLLLRVFVGRFGCFSVQSFVLWLASLWVFGFSGDFVSVGVWVLVLIFCVGLRWVFWSWFCFLWVGDLLRVSGLCGVGII